MRDGSFMRSSTKRTIQVLLAFAALLMLSLAAGCKGFFVNAPTSVSITPSTVSLTQGQSQQLIAQASFDSGSKDVTTSAFWQSSNSCAVSVTTGGSAAGKVTDVGTGGAVTITATFNGVSCSATVMGSAGIMIRCFGSICNGRLA